jgi:peptidoglycan/LPS O-acetylase OafA/YrhL
MRERELTGLDVLRGIAILLVIVAHFMPAYGQTALLLSQIAANAGVILFFLLSGFLMDRNLARDQAIMPYAIRRAFRILPTYWLSILVVAFVYGQWSFDKIAANATFTVSLFHYERMSGVYWTLYIEVLFYAIAPILRLLGERAIRVAPFAFVVAIGAMFLWRGFFHLALSYMTFCLVGMLIGSLYRSGGAKWLNPIISMKSSVLEWIGHVSYSWYLLHSPIGVPVARLANTIGSPPLLSQALGAAVSLAVCVVVYVVLEKPMIAVGRRLSKRSTSPILQTAPSPPQ